jgi:hypothetical protein
MSHLSLDQLLQLREPGAEPGTAGLRAHLEQCAACRAEADRLDQRSARLRALPSLRPARDHWPAVRQRFAADRRRRQVRWAAGLGLAAAAGLAVVLLAQRTGRHASTQQEAITEAMNRSQQLEQLIQAYDPDNRVTDGRTVRVAGELENRIAQVDRQLEVAQMLGPRDRNDALLHLWRQRVGLLDALVDVHLTRASAVEF